MASKKIDPIYLNIIDASNYLIEYKNLENILWEMPIDSFSEFLKLESVMEIMVKMFKYRKKEFVEFMSHKKQRISKDIKNIVLKDLPINDQEKSIEDIIKEI